MFIVFNTHQLFGNFNQIKLQISSSSINLHKRSANFPANPAMDFYVFVFQDALSQFHLLISFSQDVLLEILFSNHLSSDLLLEAAQPFRCLIKKATT